MANVRTDFRLDQLKGEIRSVWAEITDDDVDRAGGDGWRLIQTIQRKTGENIESIQKKLVKLFVSAHR